MRIRNTPERRGFTLLELLVVMSIIALIAGLSIGVFFRVRQTQTESATITIVNKLQSQLDQQWKAVLDNARDDARTGRLGANNNAHAAAALGGNDSRRELVIWTKMQQRLEFPRSFDEVANWPVSVGLNLPGKTYGKTSYAAPIIAAGITPVLEQNLSDDQLLQESAVLFYLAVTQGRRGVAAFNPIDHLGPHAVGDVTLTWYTRPNGTNPTFKVFVDTFGQPITFIRWPTGMSPSDELMQPPYAATNTIGGTQYVVDPQDPEMTLYLPPWSTSQQAVLFGQFIHPLGNPVRPVNMSPLVFSYGRDKQHGIKPPRLTNTGQEQSFTRNSPDEDDNIYGYRSRGVGRH
ncbi:MAG: type II secretion system protein [Gemmataceae bacterium]